MSTIKKFIRLFQPRFADLVETGKKKQTIRAAPKRMPIAGDHISLRTWTGKPYRSKQRILRESEITQVSTVVILPEGYSTQAGTFTSLAFRNHFARKDGFKNWDDMTNWFQQTHNLPFTGILIQWK